MKQLAQTKIDRILERVRTLEDLSVDDVAVLRCCSEQSILLDNLKVSPEQYRDWRKNELDPDTRGVEYDAQNELVIIKPDFVCLHEGTVSVIGKRVSDRLQERLGAATGLKYFATDGKNYSLAGKFAGSHKVADASIKKIGDRFPTAVLEFNNSETPNRLYSNAEQWLEGSNGYTKLVILVDIEETDQRDTSNDTYGLSETDFQKMTYNALFDHIQDWYSSQGIRLVGSFKVAVHLWYGDGDRQCIYTGAFSPDNLIDLTTIEDVPLRLDYLIPGGTKIENKDEEEDEDEDENEDEDEPLLFPLKRLVNVLQSSFQGTEYDRVGLLAQDRVVEDQ